jgi:hypothetical protein
LVFFLLPTSCKPKISWFSNLLVLSIPDECYSRNVTWTPTSMTSTFLIEQMTTYIFISTSVPRSYLYVWMHQNHVSDSIENT